MSPRDEVARIGYPLSKTNTFERPPGDPGLRFTLKRADSGQDCFEKFYPYLLWLRDFIHANHWLPLEIGIQFDELWADYTQQETECAKISAVKEFFSQKAHDRVLRLWDSYKALRRRVDDMGTKRVTLRVAEIANRHAEELLRDELEAEERENQRKAEEEALEEALQNPPAEGQSTDTTMDVQTGPVDSIAATSVAVAM